MAYFPPRNRRQNTLSNPGLGSIFSDALQELKTSVAVAFKQEVVTQATSLIQDSLTKVSGGASVAAPAVQGPLGPSATSAGTEIPSEGTAIPSESPLKKYAPWAVAAIGTLALIRAFGGRK